MSESSVITEALRSAIGRKSKTKILDVEKGHIRKFAEAVGDSNPLWHDELHASKSRYGAIIAPPTFLQNQALNEFVDELKALECPLSKFLNGGREIEFYRPMIPGDTITSEAKLVDLYEKQGKQGKLLFMVVEITFTNQRGELVAKTRCDFIRT